MPLYPKIHRLIQRPLIWRTLLFPLLIFILFLATTSQSYPMPSSASDKVNHIMAFVCLGMLLCWSYPRLFWVKSLLLLTGYGLAIEVIQAFLPYREFSLLDLLADAFGAVAGLWLGYLLLRGALAQPGKYGN
jgi:VanZ family protein